MPVKIKTLSSQTSKPSHYAGLFCIHRNRKFRPLISDLKIALKNYLTQLFFALYNFRNKTKRTHKKRQQNELRASGKPD